MTAPAPKPEAVPEDRESGDAWDVQDRPIPTGRGVLSAAEIEALLRPDLDDMPPEPAQPETVEPKSLSGFDNDPGSAADGARRLTAALSLALRENCGLDAVVQPSGARVSTFASAVDAASNDGAAFCFGPREGGVSAMLLVRADLATGLIELACGGASLDDLAAHTLGATDAGILRALLAPAASAFGPNTVLHRVEHRPDYAAAFSPAGLAQAVELDISVGGAAFRGALVVSEPDARATPTHARDAMTAVLTARLASLSVPISRVNRLKPGDTLVLGLKPDQPVSLLSGGRDGPLAAEGEIGRKSGKMAVRIVKRGPVLRG